MVEDIGEPEEEEKKKMKIFNGPFFSPTDNLTTCTKDRSKSVTTDFIHVSGDKTLQFDMNIGADPLQHF